MKCAIKLNDQAEKEDAAEADRERERDEWGGSSEFQPEMNHLPLLCIVSFAKYTSLYHTVHISCVVNSFVQPKTCPSSGILLTILFYCQNTYFTGSGHRMEGN